MENKEKKADYSEEILKVLATRFRTKRLAENITQRELASQAGMGYDTYRKFERTGEIMLKNLVRCAIVLDEYTPFQNLELAIQSSEINEANDVNLHHKRRRASSK